MTAAAAGAEAVAMLAAIDAAVHDNGNRTRAAVIDSLPGSGKTRYVVEWTTLHPEVTVVYLAESHELVNEKVYDQGRVSRTLYPHYEGVTRLCGVPERKALMEKFGSKHLTATALCDTCPMSIGCRATAQRAQFGNTDTRHTGSFFGTHKLVTTPVLQRFHRNFVERNDGHGPDVVFIDEDPTSALTTSMRIPPLAAAISERRSRQAMVRKPLEAEYPTVIPLVDAMVAAANGKGPFPDPLTSNLSAETVEAAATLWTRKLTDHFIIFPGGIDDFTNVVGRLLDAFAVSIRKNVNFLAPPYLGDHVERMTDATGQQVDVTVKRLYYIDGAWHERINNPDMKVIYLDATADDGLITYIHGRAPVRYGSDIHKWHNDRTHILTLKKRYTRKELGTVTHMLTPSATQLFDLVSDIISLEKAVGNRTAVMTVKDYASGKYPDVDIATYLINKGHVRDQDFRTGYYFADDRGTDRFMDCHAMIYAGYPIKNKHTEEIVAQLFGKTYHDMNMYTLKSTFVQCVGRLRPGRRPEEDHLRIWNLSDVTKGDFRGTAVTEAVVDGKDTRGTEIAKVLSEKLWSIQNRARILSNRFRESFRKVMTEVGLEELFEYHRP